MQKGLALGERLSVKRTCGGDVVDDGLWGRKLVASFQPKI
jgi:hypothetical protein